MWHEFTKSKGPFLHFFLRWFVNTWVLIWKACKYCFNCDHFFFMLPIFAMFSCHVYVWIFFPLGLRVVTSSIICSPEWLWFLFHHLISSISHELSIVWGMHLNDSDTYATLQRQKVDKAQFLLALKKPTKPKTWQYLTPRLALMALHKKFMGAVEFNGPFSSIQRLSWLRCVWGSH